MVASVVPPLTIRDPSSVRGPPGLVAAGDRARRQDGMPVLYETPRDVGADRIVNAVAGYERYRQPDGGPHGLIIVDFGTATTFDVVSPRGEYLGGAIAPGVGISTEALFARASKLPRVDLVVPPSSIGKTTVTSMQAGILFGYVGLVDGMVQRMRAELSFVPRVLATGGIAQSSPPIRRPSRRSTSCSRLTGLRIIHSRNSHGAPR